MISLKVSEKIEWYWHKNRLIDQWNHDFWSIIFDKGDNNIQWVKTVYLINGIGKIGQVCAKN